MKYVFRSMLFLVFSVLATLSALAQDCPRGQLSERFCDRNGDLVADLPDNPREWVNPSTLIFAYTPVEDPSVYARVWDGFIKHMEKVTGKRVQFFPVQSNAAQYEAMRAGRLHVAGVNTGGNPIAVNCAGFVPFAIMSAKDGSYGYEMEIITYPGSGIERIEDLRGRTLAFTSPTSNSGFKAPSALLEAEFGLQADKDFKTAFSGRHDNSILGVANRDYDAAAIANSVLGRMLDRGAVDQSRIKTIYRSQTFPTTGYGHVYNLHPDLAAKVKEAFFTFDWEGSALQEEFANEGQFLPITYKEHWAVIRTIDQAMGVTYDCR
ncbi:phosphate/phosphite/phosphonate ABC transporter substrate-binding protein [Desulfurispirillum indicum]|uniref:phosphate/phosphite/phosphonate ABC transporter substrate-binding protein n=1 Tax=Desulfurispirillum indicum TaxID=936456 RepID=UPI001CFBE09D|nr:phosphate/phosphite/phosphonate ABC transporter substrate-binding protein [Desulfurispirillum indicum]UCZ56205.1 phosphate/phosphite/phosphonate ABC transporter substrate-binding protein [Desulfurispirillum indicum]